MLHVTLSSLASGSDDLQFNTGTVLIDPRVSAPILLRINSEGITVTSDRGITGFTWSELTLGAGPTHRYGVVVNGKLLPTAHATEEAAQQVAADHRSHGNKCKVIEIPADPV